VIGFPLIAFAPVLLVGWSRVHLGRHTVGQVCAGGVLGGIIFTLMVSAL
jgi:membrane-associated phospholipid phosphatase